MTQEELDELIAVATPETWERKRAREEAQLKLGRLWTMGVLKLDKSFNYVLAQAGEADAPIISPEPSA